MTVSRKLWVTLVGALLAILVASAPAAAQQQQQRRPNILVIMEEVLAAHQDVAECAVLGIKDDLKGEVPCGFIVLKAGVNRPPEDIEKEIVALVREKIGPVAAFKLAITVARLPKTRSGKILRGTIKKMADGEPWAMPATIDDPAILDEIGSAMKQRGVGS